ncbi:MAG: SlyX family protein [Endozoicomonas sp. (ex Botrylloides leachii)]|nr:SlyX family protein [Endozoicomonas sp. (ex Botrylloides leachii)]
MNDELIDLQTQISFQEETIGQLNEVVTRQQSDILQLLEAVKQLEKSYRSLLTNMKQDIGDNEVPPHY